MRTPVAVCLPLLLVGQVAYCLGNESNDFFEAKIRPVLVKHCYECHSTEAGKARGGLKVDTRDALLRGGDSGPAIVARSTANSLLYEAIAYEGDYQMPPKGKLPDAVIADFGRWIRMGAPDPRVTKGKPRVDSEIDVEAGRSFWAYQAPQKPNLPAADPDDWAATPIDQYIAAKRQTHDLRPVADAAPSVLVRRLYFVLHGLPPTPAETQKWVAVLGEHDTFASRQAAIAKLIDGLLADRAYGERWGRHWLDVARFAESTGGDQNNVFQHAWRYRDWVIDAFNNDKPYNQFVREQIAGDLLPIADDREWAGNLIATGFLCVGQKLVGEEDQQKFFSDLVDEQIDTTTRAFLATSVACARCHDHKSDPIPQEDYYALAAIFRSTETHYGLLKAQARQATTLLDITGLGPEAGAPPLTDSEYRELAQARDNARRVVEDAMQRIRGGENVFRGTLRRIRSQRDEAETALQSYLDSGEPRVFAMGVQDRDMPLPTHLLVRGELDEPAQLIRPGVLRVLSPPGKHRLSRRVRGSGRLELADWIASDDNPLTARVMVNRVWHWIFGRGLVRTVDDFGATGEPPSHPELLDYLAVRLIEEGWSIKAIIREIALSRTWQLASDHNAESFESDPDNVYLWRANKRRLEADAIRDAMLLVSGNLDRDKPIGTLLREVGEGNVGQNVFEPVIRAIESNHRSVYLPRVRAVLPEMLDLFDAPDASLVSGARDTTSSPLQSLYMLNNKFVQEQAEHLADRFAHVPWPEKVQSLYRAVFSREATPAEVGYAEAFRRAMARSRLSADEITAAYCQALLCTAEFGAID